MPRSVLLPLALLKPLLSPALRLSKGRCLGTCPCEPYRKCVSFYSGLVCVPPGVGLGMGVTTLMPSVGWYHSVAAGTDSMLCPRLPRLKCYIVLYEQSVNLFFKSPCRISNL